MLRYRWHRLTSAGVLGLLGAGLTHADQLIVDVIGVKHFGGSMVVAVFDSADAWEAGDDAVAVGTDSVTGPQVRLIFPELAPGDYAVKLYHDENRNGELDSNMLGIPSEGYGFSQYTKGLGEPSFDDARFTIEGETSIEITLN